MDESKKNGAGIEAAEKNCCPLGQSTLRDEKDVQRILAFEHTMIGSDGLPAPRAPACETLQGCWVFT
jgi:hypothetical protein